MREIMKTYDSQPIYSGRYYLLLFLFLLPDRNFGGGHGSLLVASRDVPSDGQLLTARANSGQSSSSDVVMTKLDALAERLNNDRGGNNGQQQQQTSVLVSELQNLRRSRQDNVDTGDNEDSSSSSNSGLRSAASSDSDTSLRIKRGTATTDVKTKSLSCHWQAPVSETKRYYSVLLPHAQAVTQRDQYPGTLDFRIQDGHCHVTEAPPDFNLFCTKTTHQFLNATKGDSYFEVERKCYFKYDALKIGCVERKYNITVNGQVVLGAVETECVCDGSNCNSASKLQLFATPTQETLLVKWIIIVPTAAIYYYFASSSLLNQL